MVDKWKKDSGDETMRLNYDLNEKSVVFDIGGYKGNWSRKIYGKYKCEIHIFEPVASFYNYIKKRFSKNNNVFIYNIESIKLT